ncbi:MAG: DNA-directed RNA polymerase subunit D [Thermoplasmata archaeon]|nr:DNA-directed RNA polymerase subunit D [Thermoplasmata archaeon]MCI4337799.1 DNA-directed RNA polymerase subunit D [Thermoplasmata archaeon]MCI4341227.1 DNA-directed RNA polymerase subunit D [Thermoplasmata archaeon]
MELNTVELKTRMLRAELSGTTASQMNAIRRTLLSDLPKLAIEDVEFHLGPIRDETSGKDYDSSTSMFDEAIALRLGLLPIPTDLGQFRKKSECTCKGEGCAHCQVMYSIDKKGPCTVYARDLLPLGDATLATLEPEVPIVRLGARQALLAYATAIVGTAREHAKWQVAQAVGFFPRATIKISKRAGCTDSCLKRVAEASPSGLLEFTGGKLTYRGGDDPEKAILLLGSQRLCEHGSLQVELDDNRFVLRFETDGSLSAREAFRFALKDLRRRFEELREAVQALP